MIKHSQNEKNIDKQLKVLGYDKIWLLYGYLTLEELNTQYLLYNKAIANSKSKEAEIGYQHTEHLRYRQFCEIFKNQKTFTDKEKKQIIALIACDEDQTMSNNFYAYFDK